MRAKTPRLGDKYGKQVENISTLIRPKAPSVGDKWGRQVKDKCKSTRPKESRVGNKCGIKVEDKYKIMQPKAPKSEGQVEDKYKIMRPKSHRAGTQSRRRVWETSLQDQCGKQVRWTSVNSCAEWDTNVGDKC